MRVTQSATTRMYLRNLNSNASMMNNLTHQITTGRKFDYGYQDPSGRAQSIRIRDALFANDYYIGNMNAAYDLLTASESALMTVSDIGKEAYERVIQGMNGTMEQTDREIISNTLDNLASEILMTINSTYAERYMFGGSGNEEPPFKLEGDKLTFHGVDVNDAVAMAEFPEAKSVFYDIGLGLRFLDGTVGTDEQVSTEINPADLIETQYATSSSTISFEINMSDTSAGINVPPINITVPAAGRDPIDALDHSFDPPKEPTTDEEAVANYQTNLNKELQQQVNYAVEQAMQAAEAAGDAWPSNTNGTALVPEVKLTVSGTGAMAIDVITNPHHEGKVIEGSKIIDTSYFTATVDNLEQVVSTTLDTGDVITTTYAADGSINTTGNIAALGMTELPRMLMVDSNGDTVRDADGNLMYFDLESAKHIDVLASGGENPSSGSFVLNVKLNDVQKTITVDIYNDDFDETATPPTYYLPESTAASDPFLTEEERVAKTAQLRLEQLMINMQAELDEAYGSLPNGDKAMEVSLDDAGQITLKANEGEFVILETSKSSTVHIESFDYEDMFQINTILPALDSDEMPYGYRIPSDPLPTIDLYIDGVLYEDLVLDPRYSYTPDYIAPSSTETYPVETIERPLDAPIFDNMAAYDANDMPQTKAGIMAQTAANLEVQIKEQLLNKINTTTPPPTTPYSFDDLRGVTVTATTSGALEFSVPQNGEVKSVGATTSDELGIWTNKSQGVEVDPQTGIEVSLPGLEMLGFGTNEKGEPNNIITLISTIADEFRKEDVDTEKVSSLLNHLIEQNNVVVKGLTEIGNRTAFLEFNISRLEDMNFNLETSQSKIEYVDSAEAIMEWKSSEAAYNATLQMGSKTIPLSLFDFMR